jgi:predicted SAM-dependent methyltransferase
MEQLTQVARLHWGCGSLTPAGWINSDIREGPGVDIVGNVLEGLPLEPDSIDYISSQHVLPELKIHEQVPALRELRRVLKPGGVLRMSLPDLDRAIAAYQARRQDYFLVWECDTVAGNFVTQMLWHNTVHTLFTFEFLEELMLKAGFAEVRRVEYRKTTSPYPEIVELDNREGESFYAEAVK